MTKALYVLKEGLYLVRKHKLHFFLPLLVVLGLLTLLVHELGSAYVIAFLYAGL